MKPSLGQLLVAAPGQLQPQHARAQNVQMPQALPQNLRYGHVQPGLPQSQRFTGAVAQQQPMTQFAPPPDFVAPSYSSGYSGGSMSSGISPIAAALVLGHLGLLPHAPPPGHPSQSQAPLGSSSAPAPVVSRGPADPGSFPLAPRHGGDFPTPDGSRSVAHPASFPTANVAPEPIRSIASGLAPAPRVSAAALASIGRRGVYQV